MLSDNIHIDFLINIKKLLIAFKILMSKFTIDNELFDRQTRTYGKNLIINQSFASEVLKNLSLSGFRYFYLDDESESLDNNDLNSLFYNDCNKLNLNHLKKKF